jgi:hypothetical protein
MLWGQVERWAGALGVGAFLAWPLVQEGVLCWRERQARRRWEEAERRRELEEECLRRLLGEYEDDDATRAA